MSPSTREPRTATVDTVVIGAGQGGLAMSRCLSDAGIEHVVLERGHIGERWRQRERWESFRLLTPNWATRLPGWSYRGPDPDGFMTAAEMGRYLDDYAGSFDAPVRAGCAVGSVTRRGNRFRVSTSDGDWSAARVVMATGWCDEPRRPAAAGVLPSVAQITSDEYRSPAQLPNGGVVLVVGASASGVQIADELARAGRDVVVAVGRHTRLVRRYRGMDMWWWLERIGAFAATIDDVADRLAARDAGSLQLVGRPDQRDVDLPALEAIGVRLTGHLVDADDDRVTFADDLRASVAAADAGFAELLGRIDRHIDAEGLNGEVLPAPPPGSIRAAAAEESLPVAGLGAVVWATGYRRGYRWLHVPVLDERGEVRHRRGVTPVAGLYVLGQRFQHRRDSNFIDGVRHDAAYIADHMTTAPPSLQRTGRRP